MPEWYCRDEAGDIEDEELIEAPAAREAAELFVARRELKYADALYVHVLVRTTSPRTGGPWHTIRINAPVPRCRAAQHIWVRPRALVGGSRRDPGRWRYAGGARVLEICRRCGWYRDREIQTAPARPETIVYSEPDAASREWIARRRQMAGGA